MGWTIQWLVIFHWGQHAYVDLWLRKPKQKYVYFYFISSWKFNPCGEGDLRNEDQIRNNYPPSPKLNFCMAWEAVRNDCWNFLTLSVTLIVFVQGST